MPFIRRWNESAGRIFRGHLFWILSLFLLGLGVKFRLILQSNAPLPYFDQWEGDAADVFVPWFQHVLAPIDFFKPHNEHRIVLTRVYDFILLLLNGQWDSQLQNALNAFLHCGAIAGLGLLMTHWLGKKWWPLVWQPLAMALLLPFNWENTLWAFQSSFYFLLIFSLLTMWLIGLNEPLSGRWKLGVVCGALSLFTLASGFVAAAVVAVIVALELLKNPGAWRRQVPTFIVCGGLIIAGLLLKPELRTHDVLRAESVPDLALALARNLSWPLTNQPWIAPLNVLVFLLIAWVYWRAPRKGPMNAEKMVLMLGGWTILQAAAAAYARGNHGAPPASRHMDLLCFLTIANWLGIVVVLARHRHELRFAPVWYTAFALWAVVFVAGVGVLSTRAARVWIPSWNVRQQIRLENARAFMATDNEHLFDHEEIANLPLPYAPELVFLMRDEDIRRILPACVRKPLRIVPGTNSDNAFALNGCLLAQPEPPYEQCWGSFTGVGARARGKFESQPIKPSKLPYLEIPVAGDLGAPGLELQLVESSTGKITSINPPHAPGGRWTNIHVKSPAGEFKLLARDDSDTAWFAFKDPREMGRLSYWGLRMIELWKMFVLAGVLCLLAAIIAPYACRRRVPASSAEHGDKLPALR
jgi:hypothetical protein